ncbi:MAG: DNA mismatch endonuclease Vsr [Beijerinckiaceae bacterium]
MLRSDIMRRVKGKDTGPEKLVRSALHRLGFRFRLHRADLPGKPDIVLPSMKIAIFVHGCFWHGHDCARGAREPKTNADYWRTKIARNRVRDEAHLAELKRLGWKARILWECELKDMAKVERSLLGFLRSRAPRK